MTLPRTRPPRRAVRIGLALIVSTLAGCGLLSALRPAPDPTGLPAIGGPGRVRQEQTQGSYTLAILPGAGGAAGLTIAGTIRGPNLELLQTSEIRLNPPPVLTDATDQPWRLDGASPIQPHPYQWNPLHAPPTPWGVAAQYDYHTFTLHFAPPDGAHPPAGAPLRLRVTVSLPRDLVPGEELLAPPFTFAFPLPPP